MLAAMNQMGYGGNLAPFLDLNFAGTAALPSSVTFSRGTNGTYVNSAGNVVTTAGVNDPRFEYDPVTKICAGLLIEEARTNITQQSNTFSNAYWTKLNTVVTANATGITAPSGIVEASRITDNTTASQEHYIENQLTVFTNQTYTHSVYVRAATAPAFSLMAVHVGASVATSSIIFNQTGGVYSPASQTNGLITAAAAVNAGNGWYRCAITYTLNGTVTVHSLRIYPNLTGFYTGTTIGHYFWGAQTEAGSVATSYIPTTTASVTRNADAGTMTGTNFSSWYNQTQGTIVAIADKPFLDPAGPTHNSLAISDGTAANRHTIFNQSMSAGCYTVTTGGVAQALFSQTNAVSVGVPWKSATAYALNDIAGSWNGVTPITIATATLPVVTTLYLGTGSTGLTSYLNGRIARITYYPIRLPNATLQVLST